MFEFEKNKPKKLKLGNKTKEISLLRQDIFETVEKIKPLLKNKFLLGELSCLYSSIDNNDHFIAGKEFIDLLRRIQKNGDYTIENLLLELDNKLIQLGKLIKIQNYRKFTT